MTRDVVIIGGGIAGLSAAYALGPHSRSVTVLEREALPFSHASGRNAAIYRPLEGDDVTSALAAKTPHLLGELGGGAPLLDRSGLCLLSSEARVLAPYVGRAALLGITHRLLEAGELSRAFPELEGGRNRYALHLPQAGVLDIHGIGEALRKRALALGARLRTDTEVRSLCHNGHRVTGVECADGQTIAATDVILAAGAWSATLAATCDAALPLVPYRRHLAQLVAPAETEVAKTVHWDLDTGVYVRKEGSGLLATPGDHTPHAACPPAVDPSALERLAVQLHSLVPRYRESRVRNVWGCLRTLSPDHAMVVGQGSRLDGLYWFGGLAGHGMSAGLGASEVLRDAFLDRANPFRVALSATRFE
ncbi:MAG: hypothetical protein RJA70_1288 [Pseudomonadota bacterium]|jgi:glycine/D-amino acid oxidase-like deaminating enzyme